MWPDLVSGESQAEPLTAHYSPPATFERGTPFAAWGGPDVAAPAFRMIPDREREAQAARLGAGAWLAVVAVVWLLSLVPAVRRRTRSFWPEQLLILGAIGWYVAGPRPVTLAFLAAWATVRLVRLGRIAVRHPVRQAGSAS